MNEKLFKKAFLHTFEELEIPNIIISLQKSDFKKLQQAHDSIHEYLYLPSKLIEIGDTFYENSAFATYQWETFDQAHSSFIEALSGCYNPANSLLRNTLELVIKGAFWECIAHEKFRENAKVISEKTGARIEGVKRTLIDWFNDIFEEKASIKEELEKNSIIIFDKISPLFEDEELGRVIPSMKKMIEQLDYWKIFIPIQEAMNYVYGVYKELCKDVHVNPDRTNIGRRLLANRELFEVEVIPEELNKYAETLLKIIDIGIVVSLNVLVEFIKDVDHTKIWLKERLGTVRELDLDYTAKRIEEIVES
jgi:hypothetical protein